MTIDRANDLVARAITNAWNVLWLSGIAHGDELSWNVGMIYEATSDQTVNPIYYNYSYGLRV